MKAALYKGSGVFSVEDVPIPKVSPNQVLVKVKYCAICGTDVHTVLYDVLEPDSIMGHEYCGTISEIGEKVTKWKIGDRVVGGGGDSPPGVPYGIMGDPRFSYRQSLSQDQTSGAYAEYICLQEWEPMAQGSHMAAARSDTSSGMAIGSHSCKQMYSA
jgi:threonine dehydrogenase-like Zn-dependent dehydrogenase